MTQARESLYRSNILEHYKHPHHWGRLTDSDLSRFESNSLCGDELQLDLKLDAEGRISEVGFSGSGCAISVSSASMLSDRLIGLTLTQAKKINSKTVLSDLGIDPGPSRLKCALLGWGVLQSSILEFEKTKSEQKIPSKKKPKLDKRA